MMDEQLKKLESEAEESTENHDDAVCFLTGKEIEPTVDEVVQYFEMKNSKNITSMPPVLPKAGELYLFVNSDPSKSGIYIAIYTCNIIELIYIDI